MTRLPLRQLAMLRALAYMPRALQGFTNGGGSYSGVSPLIATGYLRAMQDEGFVEVDDRGVWSATEEGRAYLASLVEPVQPRTFGPWSTPSGSLVVKPWVPARPGAMDASRVKSLGVGC